MGLFRYTWATFLREIGLLILAVIWWIPFYFLVVMALKTDAETFQSAMSLPAVPQWSNFPRAWQEGNLGASILNAAIMTSGTVALLIVFGSGCAYVLARRNGYMSEAMYLVFVIGIILPFQLGIVPTFMVMQHMGLVGQYLGMILLYTGIEMPLAVFLYTGFVRTLPREYEEAAQVDGASRIRTFLLVVFPLLRPVTGTVAILTGVFVWNEFFLSVIFLGGSGKQSIPVAIYSFVGEFAFRWNLIFAGVIISLIPVVAFFLLAQRQMIQGFSGGIKS